MSILLLTPASCCSMLRSRGIAVSTLQMVSVFPFLFPYNAMSCMSYFGGPTGGFSLTIISSPRGPCDIPPSGPPTPISFPTFFGHPQWSSTLHHSPHRLGTRLFSYVCLTLYWHLLTTPRWMRITGPASAIPTLDALPPQPKFFRPPFP